MSRRIDFDSKKVSEAFKVGNRARKKESDTAGIIDPVQAQVDLFREQTGIELEIRDGRPYCNKSISINHNDRLTAIPVNLVVMGDATFSYCKNLRICPAGLTVKGDLNFSGCKNLAEIPANLNVDGAMFLNDCASLKSLPDGMTVGGIMSLWGCIGLTVLPRRLTVGGSLSLRKCYNLKSLPSDLTVNGKAIQSIPDNLHPFIKKLGIKGVFKINASEWMAKRHLADQVTEAFKAGNWARKKESVQDAIEGIDIQVTKKTCTETVEKLAKSGRFSKIGINDLLVHVMSDTAAEIGGFDKVELLTAMQGHGFWEENTLWTEVKSDTGWFPDIYIGDGVNYGEYEPGGICYIWFTNKRTPGEPVAWHRITPYSRWIIYDRFVDIIKDIIIRARRENIPAAVNEAFKAGNRARKKETAQDTVGIFDDLLITPDRVRDYIGTDIQSVEKMCTNGSWRELINRLLSEVFEKPHSNVHTYTKHENGVSISTYYYTGRESHIMVSGNNGYVMRLRVDGEGHPDKFTVGITFYDRGVRCLRGRGGDKEYETVLERDNWRRDDGYGFNDEGLLMFCQFLSTGIVPAGFAVEDVVLDEAFKAGNKARKKEAMQDAAAVTDSVNLSFMDTIGEIESFLCRRGEQEDRVMTAEGDAIDSGKWFDWRGRTEDYQALVIEVENIDGDTCNVYVYVDATGVPSTFDATGQHRMDFECTRSLSNRVVLNNVLSIFDRLAGPAGEDELPEDLREGDENWEIYKNLTQRHADFLRPFLCKQDLDRLIVDGVLDEAFKAGNRARKKESAQDTAESADRPVTFDEALGEIERLIHRIGSKYKRGSHNNLYSKQRPEAQAEIFHIHPFSSNELTDNDVSRDGFYPGGWSEKVTHSYDAVVDLAYFPELDRTFVMMCANVCTVDPGDIRHMSVFNRAGSYSEYYMGDYTDKDPLRDTGDYDLMGSEFFYPVDTVSDLGRTLEIVTYMLTDKRWLACMALFTVCRSFSSQYTRSLLPGAICPYIRKDIRISPEMLHSAVNGALWNELLVKSNGLCGAIVDGRFTYKEILDMFEPDEYRPESGQPKVLW